MKITTRDLTFRWLALATTVLNIIFNGTYYYILNSATIADVTKNYPASLTPAGYTFSIWGLIYLAFIVYGIVQLMPSHRSYSIHDKLSAPVIFINILSSAWIVFYTENFIGVSVIILALAFIVAYRGFRRAYLAVHYGDYNLWLQFPFSLISGWLTVAFAANLMVYFSYLGLSPVIGEVSISIILIVVLTAIAFLISVNSHSLVYPAAISWGLIGISIAQRNENTDFSTIALSTAIFLVAGTFIAAVFRRIPVRKQVRHHWDF